MRIKDQKCRCVRREPRQSSLTARRNLEQACLRVAPDLQNVGRVSGVVDEDGDPERPGFGTGEYVGRHDE